ncbi:hypothetical protein [Nocardiopsis sp. NRRL B-16309]|uniref:hypothetical protein n=1 Tax=Nocardiopsis sp. NRRL B-16309 TaxID=1519494 RepID=UPI0012E10591|nr:hypothetical protein [Nocardiopsis sp. NRRL B-16309]
MATALIAGLASLFGGILGATSTILIESIRLRGQRKLESEARKIQEKEKIDDMISVRLSKLHSLCFAFIEKIYRLSAESKSGSAHRASVALDDARAAYFSALTAAEELRGASSSGALRRAIERLVVQLDLMGKAMISGELEIEDSERSLRMSLVACTLSFNPTIKRSEEEEAYGRSLMHLKETREGIARQASEERSGRAD